MRRAVAHYFPREMAVLGLVECSLSFIVIYGIQAADASALLTSLAAILQSGGVVIAAGLTLIVAAVALAYGLYRTELRLERKRLMIATLLAAIITCAISMLVDAGTSNGLASNHSLYIVKVIGSWLAVMAMIRPTYNVVGRRPKIRRVPLPGDSLQPSGMRILSAAPFQKNHPGLLDLDAPSTNDLLLGPGFTTQKISAALKRLCDLVVSTAMLMLVLPLVTLTALAIKIDSRGPVFDRQQRVGRSGKTFTLYKFRSIAADAEASGNPLSARAQDPRVTRIGRYIRATRIDGLPQLLNVMRGEMSMVGPRPERPYFAEQLARLIPFYRQRTDIKPGLTGWAQINFPYGACVEDAREKLAYDLYYVKNRSISLDLTILFSTVRVVLLRAGVR